MAKKRDIKGSAETNIRQGQRIRRLQEDVEECQRNIFLLARKIKKIDRYMNVLMFTLGLMLVLLTLLLTGL